MPVTYPVLFDERCYDLASHFLEDEPGLFNHDNANELAGIVQQAVEDWIATARENYEPKTT